jgi:methionyl-tRNA synthetase
MAVKKRRSIYLTTPIYYPNDAPHLGTAYTTLATDILNRWSKLNGRKSFFLTGLDEHGQKIENAAHRQGLKPQALVDKQAEVFEATFGKLNIKYDRFIRTTDEDHINTVREILNKVYSMGDIYKGKYYGLYCIDCESYYTERDLDKGNCRIHKRPAELLSEECYYFRLSKYRDWLLQYYEENPNFIQPANRYTEIINIVKEGLEDLNISRSSFKWGIPLPFDKAHITYVWFDALLNYISGIDFLTHPDKFEKFWENAVHLIGKDILRFHAIIWIAMLKSIGIKPPEKIFAHGFWTINGQKFSKSLGNAVSPDYLVDSYGLDPLRYYMFRAFPFGADGNFSELDLIQRNNSELAKGLGNLVQRTTKMIEKYCAKTIPLSDFSGKSEQEIAEKASLIVSEISRAMENIDFHKVLTHIWEFIAELNIYTNARAPWILAKNGEIKLLHTTLATLSEGLRFVSVLVSPFMPDSSQEICNRIGLSTIPKIQDLRWGSNLAGKVVNSGNPIFPLLKVRIAE